VNDFSAHWLALREPADAAARSARLARRFAAALPPRARIFDLGAGTGANARYLAPFIVGDREWILVERDPRLRAAQESSFRSWARRNRYSFRQTGRGMVIETKDARWRFTSRVFDLAKGCAGLPVRPGDGVTAAAFFDLVSSPWLARFAGWLAERDTAFLAALTIDGRRQWRPALSSDALVALAFRRDQARDKGFGAALGAEAVAALPRALRAKKLAVATVASDWRLGSGERALVAALVRADAALARAAWPERAEIVATWRRQRLKGARAGRLALTVGHRDILTMPGRI